MKKLIEEAKALGIETDKFTKSADLKAEIARVKALSAQNTTQETAEDNASPEETKTGENATQETAEDNATPEEAKAGENKPEESVKTETSTGNTIEASNERLNTSETPTTWTNEIGEVWAFTKKAPKTLNWKLKTYTQAEILSNDDIMEQLTTGAYSQIKRIK